MESVRNFRECGGWLTADGACVRRGVLFRSATLAMLSAADRDSLRALGIRTIVDLRTDRERRRHPDRLDPSSGIAYRHIPIKSRRHDDSGTLSQLFSLIFGKARRMRFDEVMEEVYREYVTDFRSELATVVRMVAEPAHLPLLIHCTAGKDRTGLAVAIILTALGVPSDVIVDDYLRSNHHLAAFRREVTRKLSRFAVVGVSPERVVPLFEARREYLSAALDQVALDYGTFDRYVEYGLGLTAGDRKRLGDALLESIPPPSTERS